MITETLPEVEVPKIDFGEVFPEYLTVQVTPVDIFKGIRGSQKDCAIARAAGRRFDGTDVRVGSHGIMIGFSEGTPPVCYVPDDQGAHRDFIARFDCGSYVPPCELRYTKATVADYMRSGLDYVPLGVFTVEKCTMTEEGSSKWKIFINDEAYTPKVEDFSVLP